MKGARKEIAGAYLLKGENQISFQVSDYDARQPLVIDPLLSYSTYLGGTFEEQPGAIAVDSTGTAYLTGITCSPNFPDSPPPVVNIIYHGGCDAFITRLDPTKPPASQLIFTTLVGGTGFDGATDITLDPTGNIYIAGGTLSFDFPTVNPRQGFLKGTNDAFITQLSPSGATILYSTYFGGTGAETLQSKVSLAVHSGIIYIAGITDSTDFPTMNPRQASNHGGENSYDAFLALLNPEEPPFLQLIYSTYLGGTEDEEWLAGLVLGSSGNAYLFGKTFSSDFPTMNAFQATSPRRFQRLCDGAEPI